MSASDDIGGDHEGHSALVAEYVLGLLPAGQHERVGRLIEADAALRNAIAWSAQLDPMEHPDGDQALGGGWRLQWEATLVEPLHDGATGYLQPGLYQLGLYDLHLGLWREGTLRREARLRRVGYRQVRHPEAL